MASDGSLIGVRLDLPPGEGIFRYDSSWFFWQVRISNSATDALQRLGCVPFLFALAVNGNRLVFRFSGILGAPSFAMALSAISSALIHFSYNHFSKRSTAVAENRPPPISTSLILKKVAAVAEHRLYFERNQFGLCVTNLGCA